MKCKKLAAILVIWVMVMVCSLTGFTAVKETVIREGFTVLEQNENPVGFCFNQLRQNDTGFIYISDITMQTCRLGTPAKITKHMELTVDKQYLARRSLVIIDTNGSKTSFKTEFNQTDIKMSATSSDGKETPTVFKPGKPVYFQVSFLDSLIAAKKMIPGKEYGVLIWDLNTMAPLECKLKINAKTTYSYGEKTIPVFEVSGSAGVNRTNLLVDAKGNTYWEEAPEQKLIGYKAEKDRISELQATLTDILLVPGNIMVSQPFQSESSQIKVTWKTPEFSYFQFEDNRQKLTKQVENAAGHEVTLTVQSDHRDFTGKARLPVSDIQFNNYLGESTYITPGLPEVQKVKEEVLAGETDGWVAAQKILDWVFNYIQPEPISLTLSTEEILAQKRGKSTESAILFAAIARSAGLPTRLAWGERYQDGAWVGHIWNEVWLGEWISVDASHHQSAPDALLLKFADSDTVMGTQKLQASLVGQLGINIEDLKVPQNEPTPTAILNTGITDNVYTNAEFRLRIQVPAGWKMIETKEQDTPMLVMQNPDDPNCNAILILSSVSSGTTAEQILNSRIQLTQATVEGFNLIHQGQGSLGGGRIEDKASGETFPGGVTSPEETALNEGDSLNQEAALSENLPDESALFQGGALSQGGASDQNAISPAYQATFGVWSFTFQGSTIYQEIWLLIQKDFLYLLVFTAPEMKWEDDQTLFQQIRAGFQIW